MMKIDVDYWTEVRQRIIEMRHIDFSCNMVFGSNSHKYKINRRVSERRLRAFEVKNDVELPSEYRAFLTAFGAGGAGPDYGIYSFARIGSHSVRERFHLTESCEWPEDDDDPIWDLPGLLPISTSGCGIDWSIEINGPQPGTMWVDAGPGDQLMRCDSFGTWYSKWLDRIEDGLRKYQVIAEMVFWGTAVEEISKAIDVEPYAIEDDGASYLRFQDVPGRIRTDGKRALSLEVGGCWIM